MKTALIFTVLGIFLLVGCVTTREGFITIPPEVQAMSKTDEVLFHDLLAARGGVGHADFTLYPHSKQKTLTRIEVLTPYDNHQIGEEHWYIKHEDGETCCYLVRLIPDSHGGTTFTVQKEQGKVAK